MSSFEALPVGKGDAFLWRLDDGRTVLVDGGQRRKKALAELRARCVTKIDVMVCTHADSDHAKGLLAVLKAPDVQVDELWVPARWGDGVGELASDPLRVLHQLADECAKSRLGGLESDLPVPGDPADDDGGDLMLAEVEDQVSDGPNLNPLLAGHQVWFPWLLRHPPPPSPLWLQAVEVAGSIWAIVRAALHAGTALRWFKYGESPAGGLTWLAPANAEQTVRARRTKNFLRWLWLTLKNEEALVFVGRDQGEPPLLFSSDSDFRFNLGPIPQTHMLVTAPHHGSQANAHVYQLINGRAPVDHLWIRSDTRSQARPCAEYLAISKSARGCTECHGCARRLARVEAEVRAGRWVLRTPSCPK